MYIFAFLQFKVFYKVTFDFFSFCRLLIIVLFRLQMFGEFPYSHIFGNIFFIVMKFEISSMFARDFFSLLYYLGVSAVL